MIENKDLDTEIEQQSEEKKLQQDGYLALLHNSAFGLVDQLDLDEILKRIVDRAGNLVGTEHAFLYLLDQNKQTFTEQIGFGVFADGVGRKIPVTQGGLGEIYATGKYIVIDDYSAWPDRIEDRAFAQLHALLHVPLMTKGGLIGTMGVAFLEPERRFNETQIQMLLQFAEIASIALENTKLHNTLRSELGERHKAEEALTKSEANNRALLSAIPDTICRMDKKGEILDFRKGKEQQFHMENKEYLGLSIKDIFPMDVAQKILHYMNSFCPNGDIQTLEYYVEGNGTERFFQEVRVVSMQEEFLVIIRDISKRKEMEKQLEYLGAHDTLTGQYNRNYFEQEMRRFNGDKYAPVGIIICDLDGLKLINDSFGHECGDELLALAANAIRSATVAWDVVARVGGDEFAVLLPRATLARVEFICDKIREAVVSHNANKPKLPLRISIGYAVSGDDFADTGALFKEADDNMYREKLYQNASARNSIVQMMIKALEARDFIAQGHADRVQDYAQDIAEELDLPEKTIEKIRLLAKFHDIGKIGVPDEIVFKPNRLTPEEFAEMRRHSEIGYRLALSIPELATIAEWILKHHEWWNGNGYPLGISGTNIPLECRIISIADAFDAMTSDRPYREAISTQQAIAEIKACAGTQFDPKIVEIFERLILRTAGPKSAWFLP